MRRHCQHFYLGWKNPRYHRMQILGQTLSEVFIWHIFLPWDSSRIKTSKGSVRGFKPENTSDFAIRGKYAGGAGRCKWKWCRSPVSTNYVVVFPGQFHVEERNVIWSPFFIFSFTASSWNEKDKFEKPLTPSSTWKSSVSSEIDAEICSTFVTSLIQDLTT